MFLGGTVANAAPENTLIAKAAEAGQRLDMARATRRAATGMRGAAIGTLTATTGHMDKAIARPLSQRSARLSFGSDPGDRAWRVKPPALLGRLEPRRIARKALSGWLKALYPALSVTGH